MKKAKLDSNHEDERLRMLRDAPRQLGASWARQWFRTMTAETRSISGGWPGTVPEARALVKLHFDREFRNRGMALLTQSELAMAATSVYAHAKSDWLQAVRSPREVPDGLTAPSGID